VIPNSELFKNSVTVNTAFDTRRLEYDFKIADATQIDTAKAAILVVLQSQKDVLTDPKADVIVTALDPSSVTLRARWWSRSKSSDVLLAQDRVLSAARRALQSAAITPPVQPVTSVPIPVASLQQDADDHRPRTALEKDRPEREDQRDR